jgi:succinate-acetate transporter protein
MKPAPSKSANLKPLGLVAFGLAVATLTVFLVLPFQGLWVWLP